MADTALQLAAKIKAISDARDTGVLFVRNGDSQTHFRSLVEMDSIIANLKQQLATLNGSTPRRRVRYIEQRSKGFGTVPGVDQ